MRVAADADLPWYWGTGAATAVGDSGLRSSLGYQLDSMRAGVEINRTVDSSRSEGDMLSRLGAAERMRAVRGRLQAMDDRTLAVLWCHYGTRPLAFGLSGAAVLSPTAQAMIVCADTAREGLSSELRRRFTAGDRDTLRDVRIESDIMVREARERFDRG